MGDTADRDEAEYWGSEASVEYFKESPPKPQNKPMPLNKSLERIHGELERILGSAANYEQGEQVQALIQSELKKQREDIRSKLPEKKEAKAPYEILELEKAFQNGRSQAIDQITKILEGAI